MLLQLDPASSVPLYQQIRDQIRQLIATGALGVGERLPPSRELAQRLGVHRTTIANAYAELTADGWIAGHVGRGTYVAESPQAIHRPALPPPKYSASLENGYLWSRLLADAPAADPLDFLMAEGMPANGRVISFTTARPAEELFPIEEFRRVTSEVIRREGRALLQLGPSDGYPPLKEFLRHELRREGIQAGDRELLVTNGCQQALDLIRKVFLRPGDVVLMENPVYPGAIQTFNTGGVKCLGVPVTEEGLNLDVLESLLAQERVRLLLLTPNFHNPTGTTLSLEGRKRLLELARLHQLPVVEDNIYGALRIAKQATDLHTDQLAQAALAEFGRRGLLARMVKRARALYRTRLQSLEAALGAHFPDEVTWGRPEGGMAVWVTLPVGLDAGVLLFKARERGVLFTPGRYFYFQAVQPNTLRLAFATVAEKQIRKGVEILGHLLKAELRQRRGAPEGRRARVALV